MSQTKICSHQFPHTNNRDPLAKCNFCDLYFHVGCCYRIHKHDNQPKCMNCQIKDCNNKVNIGCIKCKNNICWMHYNFPTKKCTKCYKCI